MQVPVLQVYCDVSMQPARFLFQWLPTAADASMPSNYLRQALQLQTTMLQQMVAQLAREAQQRHLAVAAWSSSLASSVKAARYKGRH